jgi:nitric oxide reductase large subunit
LHLGAVGGYLSQEGSEHVAVVKLRNSLFVVAAAPCAVRSAVAVGHGVPGCVWMGRLCPSVVTFGEPGTAGCAGHSHVTHVACFGLYIIIIIMLPIRFVHKHFSKQFRTKMASPMSLIVSLIRLAVCSCFDLHHVVAFAGCMP